MRRRRSTLGHLLLAGSVAALMAVPAAAAAADAPGNQGCSPRVIDLGTLGGPQSGIDGDNGRDTFVGDAEIAAGHPRAVLFHTDGTIVDLGQPTAEASDENGVGIVVGAAQITTPHEYAFAWYRGRAVRLPAPSWAVSTFARRINDRGDVAGSLVDQRGHTHPAVWVGLTFLRVLPIPPGYTDAFALGINDRGELVGAAGHPQNDPADPFEQEAWWWHEDRTNGPLRPDFRGGLEQANVVNERGWAAGTLDYGGQFGAWAAVWRDGSLIKLGPTQGVQFSFTYGGDETGDYVGDAGYSPSDQYAHVFLTQLGQHVLYTLRPLSGKLDDESNAHSVIPHLGRLGTVVGGDSTTAGGQSHATLWTCAWQQVIAPPHIPSASATTGRAVHPKVGRS